MTERVVDRVLYFANGQPQSDSLVDAESVLKAIKVRTPSVEVTDSNYANANTLNKDGLSLTDATGTDEQRLTHQILKNLILLQSGSDFLPAYTAADAGKILTVAGDGTLLWQTPIIDIDGGDPFTPCIYDIDGGTP